MPDLSARPLLASALDAKLFVDRERELSALELSARARLNALVIGERGVGKTSLLHQLERRLEDDAQIAPVFVDGARRAERPEELLSLLAYRLDPEQARFSHLEELMRSAGRRPPRTSTEDLLAALGSVREAISRAEQRPLVIIDELPSGDVAHTLFGQLRDELWSLPATWLVAAPADEQAGYLRPPANAFFETRVTVEPLVETEALRLLGRRTTDARPSEAVMRDVAAAAGGNPRGLIELARQALVEGRSVQEAAGVSAARRQRARELGEAAVRLVAYLEAHGPASASDEQLLTALGWSRSRATQMLRELDQAGLVTPTSERSQAGRRKVYTLADLENAT